MSKGSCLCGTVSWEVDPPLQFTSHCHCGRCRKAHGAAFATSVAAPLSDFRLSGREQIRIYQSSPELGRAFCGTCGSVVPQGDYNGLVFVPAGNFEDAAAVEPLAHIFVASKAPWHVIGDSVPQFDAYPPGFDSAVLPDLSRDTAPEGAVCGSCLCGGVAYVIDSPPLRCWNCHCLRCRKARSAAYASNLITAVDGLRFTRGQDLLQSYKIPEAKWFRQVFCATCGSIMPRQDHDRGLAIIPMGSLDGDPGMRPQAHIFVESKAPWVTIADALPQHAGYPPDR